MSKTILLSNETVLLPTQPSGDHERIIIVKPSQGASVSLEYKCGEGFESLKTYTELSFDRIFIKGIQSRLVAVGSATIELGD